MPVEVEEYEKPINDLVEESRIFFNRSHASPPLLLSLQALLNTRTQTKHSVCVFELELELQSKLLTHRVRKPRMLCGPSANSISFTLLYNEPPFSFLSDTHTS